MVAAITHRGDLAKTREQTRRALDPASRTDAAYEYRIITPAGEHRRIAVNGRAVTRSITAGMPRPRLPMAAHYPK